MRTNHHPASIAKLKETVKFPSKAKTIEENVQNTNSIAEIKDITVKINMCIS